MKIQDIFPAYNGKPGTYESTARHYIHTDDPWLILDVQEIIGGLRFLSWVRHYHFDNGGDHPGYRWEWSTRDEGHAARELHRFFHDRGYSIDGKRLR